MCLIFKGRHCLVQASQLARLRLQRRLCWNAIWQAHPMALAHPQSQTVRVPLIRPSGAVAKLIVMKTCWVVNAHILRQRGLPMLLICRVSDTLLRLYEG